MPKPSSLLFVNVPAFGHVFPTLGVVEELVSRGHRVRYLIAECDVAAAIRRTGAEVVALPSRFTEVMPKPTKDGFTSTNLSFKLLEEAAGALATVVDEARATQADAIVYESFALAGRFAAQATGIPAVKLYPSYPGTRSWSVMSEANIQAVSFAMTPADPAVMGSLAAGIKRDYGIEVPQDPFALFSQGEATNVVFMPREFHPAAGDLGESFAFVGPTVAAGRHTPLAPELAKFLARPEPLVYVSLGTVFNSWADFFPMVVEALAELTVGGKPVKVLMVVAKNRVEQALPPQFFAASFVPQLAVLESTTAFISHGGMNSAMESLLAGVPTVVVPQMMEQAATASRIEELGAGVKLLRRDVTAASLGAAVSRVLETPTYRAAARRLGDACRAAGGPSRAADVILAAARQGGAAD